MDNSIIDDDPSFLILITIFVGLLSIPLLLVVIITASIAYSKTREFQRTKSGQAPPPSESESLMKSIEEDSDSDLDPEDSGDEAVLKIREEKRRDSTLSSKEYFWKQFAMAWKGDKNARNLQKVKEREERRKLAKRVARELAKMEKKRNKAAGLPSYGNVVGNEKRA